MQTMEGVGIDKLPQKGRWTSLQNKKARTMKAIEALEASRASVHSSVVSSTASAADKQTLHENLRNANPRLYAMGLEGLFRPVKAVECSCPRCADDQACAGLRPMSKTDLNSGALKNKAEMSKELGAHGLDVKGNKKDLQERLKTLAQRGAYYLTAEAPVIVPGSPAERGGEAPPAPTVDPRAYSRPALGVAIAPSCASLSPDGPVGETRDMRRYRVIEESEAAMPRPNIFEGIADDPVLSTTYGFGFSAILAGSLRYSDYKRFMFARGHTRKLTFREWGEVTDLSLYLSQRLLNDYIRAGIEVSRDVNEQFRARQLEGWQEHWPLGQHAERARALLVDTCWPVPGYTSPHGMTHLQDATTQLVLAVCHLTKHRDTSEVNPPPPSAAAPPTQRPPLDNFVPLSVPQRERPVRALLQGIVREHGRCRDW